MIKLPNHQVGLATLWFVLLLIGWRSVVDTFALAMHDSDSTYILLILPISAAIMFLEWRSLRTIATLNLLNGFVILAVAGLTASIALIVPIPIPSDALLSLKMFALVLAWIGAFELFFGTRALRTALFPLLLMFGLVPIPRLALNEVVTLLQHGSAMTARLFFAAFDVPVIQSGIRIAIPGLTLEVAEECSSIRSSSMLLVATVVMAQLLLRSPWRKALLICLVVPLSLAKNGLRIFTIGMLTTRVDPGYLTGRFHQQGGILFFLVALIGVLVPLWVLRRGENLYPKSDPIREMTVLESK